MSQGCWILLCHDSKQLSNDLRLCRIRIMIAIYIKEKKNKS